MHFRFDEFDKVIFLFFFFAFINIRILFTHIEKLHIFQFDNFDVTCGKLDFWQKENSLFLRIKNERNIIYGWSRIETNANEEFQGDMLHPVLNRRKVKTNVILSQR